MQDERAFLRYPMHQIGDSEGARTAG